MSAEVNEFRMAVMETLHRMADAEAALARKVHPLDEVSEAWMYQHSEMCLREAALAVEGLSCE